MAVSPPVPRPNSARGADDWAVLGNRHSHKVHHRTPHTVRRAISQVNTIVKTYMYLHDCRIPLQLHDASILFSLTDPTVQTLSGQLWCAKFHDFTILAPP